MNYISFVSFEYAEEAVTNYAGQLGVLKECNVVHEDITCQVRLRCDAALCYVLEQSFEVWD